MSILMPAPRSFNYHNFVISVEIRKCESSQFVLFFFQFVLLSQDSFRYSWPPVIYVNLRISFYISPKILPLLSWSPPLRRILTTAFHPKGHPSDSSPQALRLILIGSVGPTCFPGLVNNLLRCRLPRVWSTQPFYQHYAYEVRSTLSSYTWNSFWKFKSPFDLGLMLFLSSIKEVHGKLVGLGLSGPFYGLKWICLHSISALLCPLTPFIWTFAALAIVSALICWAPDIH